MKKFHIWLEGKGFRTVNIPIEKLIMTKSELAEAAENIARGYPAVTEGNVHVADMGDGYYHLVNGYHRMIPMILEGDEIIPAEVDLSYGVKPWEMPTKDRFVYDPDERYKGLEHFIEFYVLRKIH
jgi:hypothetical protein